MNAAGNFTDFDAHGLNLHAVFDLDALRPHMGAALRARESDPTFRQLILIGHGGRALWTALPAAQTQSEDPIDDFSVAHVTAWFEGRCAGHEYRLVYPGGALVPLQALGRRAGWHHDSPLGLGINARFGTWFAYRVALLADTALPVTQPWPEASPCAACVGKPCSTDCPGGAVVESGFALARCARQRRRPASVCRENCPARLACPVAAGHRYTDEQMRYHYGVSLRALERTR